MKDAEEFVTMLVTEFRLQATVCIYIYIYTFSAFPGFMIQSPWD